MKQKKNEYVIRRTDIFKPSWLKTFAVVVLKKKTIYLIRKATIANNKLYNTL